MMPSSERASVLYRILLAVELVTIVAGLVATVYVFVRSRHDHRPHPDDTAEVVNVPSACSGATGTLASLRAWLDGAELPAEPIGSAPSIDPAMRARGAELFTQHCTTCHGERGDGTGPTAAELIHRPANFTLGTYELRTTEHEALPADVDLFRTISRGVHGTAMPPWFALPERDRWSLVAHLKTLSTQFQEDEAPPPAIAQPPPVTGERIAHGAQIFAKGGCASCHGDRGHGDGPAASSLFYKSGAPAKPRDLTEGRYHRGTSLGDIYLTIVTGLDGTPMASFSKVLPPDDLWDVAMFVHSQSPRFVDTASGIRCPQSPLASSADEVVGVRALIHSLQPTN